MFSSVWPRRSALLPHPDGFQSEVIPSSPSSSCLFLPVSLNSLTVLIPIFLIVIGFRIPASHSHPCFSSCSYSEKKPKTTFPVKSSCILIPSLGNHSLEKLLFYFLLSFPNPHLFLLEFIIPATNQYLISCRLFSSSHILVYFTSMTLIYFLFYISIFFSVMFRFLPLSVGLQLNSSACTHTHTLMDGDISESCVQTADDQRRPADQPPSASP